MLLVQIIHLVLVVMVVMVYNIQLGQLQLQLGLIADIMPEVVVELLKVAQLMDKVEMEAGVEEVLQIVDKLMVVQAQQILVVAVVVPIVLLVVQPEDLE